MGLRPYIAVTHKYVDSVSMQLKQTRKTYEPQSICNLAEFGSSRGRR